MASRVPVFALPEYKIIVDNAISSLNVTALPGIPLIQKGDDLSQIILDSVAKLGLQLETGDALVVTSKVVSKAEGRLFDLREVEPGAEAHRLAGETRPPVAQVFMQARLGRIQPNHLPPPVKGLRFA